MCGFNNVQGHSSFFLFIVLWFCFCFHVFNFDSISIFNRADAASGIKRHFFKYLDHAKFHVSASSIFLNILVQGYSHYKKSVLHLNIDPLFPIQYHLETETYADDSLPAVNLAQQGNSITFAVTIVIHKSHNLVGTLGRSEFGPK